jgi:hypothetical protein
MDSFQFPDVVAFCENMADRGKIVIIAALDGTYQRKVRLFYVNYVACQFWLEDSWILMRNWH